MGNDIVCYIERLDPATCADTLCVPDTLWPRLCGEQSSANVTVIDTASNTVVGSPIAVGTNPTAIALNPSGSRAYVANFDSNNVTAKSCEYGRCRRLNSATW